MEQILNEFYKCLLLTILERRHIKMDTSEFATFDTLPSNAFPTNNSCHLPRFRWNTWLGHQVVDLHTIPS
jgi:hypothetical protein